jgi:hypothetical protein
MGTMNKSVLKFCHCVVIIGTMLSGTAAAQTGGSVDPLKLLRGKYWIKCLPNGALDRETTPNQWESLYPGHYSGQAESAGGWDNTAIYNGAIVAGQPVAWFYRAAQFNSTNIFSVEPTAVSKNYDLTNFQRPEEYMTGTIGSFKTDASGNRHMAYELKCQTSVWSQPGYDRFVIMDCTLKNMDDTTFNDFYYARLVTPNGPSRPSTVTSGWDKEYEWDSEMGDTAGFIFYDGTSMPPTSTWPVYSIPPGDSTGDAGDPGNIGVQGSRDLKLYSPYVYAYTFDYGSLPANNKGIKKIWRRILSASSAPQDNKELLPGRYDQMANYTTMVATITDEQPRIGWRAAYDSIQKGASIPGAGSLWERNPRYLYAIGPYTIPPGGTLRWREIFVAGEMDRNVSMLGGYEATRRFKAEGIANLKQNLRNAVAMIKQSGTSNPLMLPLSLISKGGIPPPTPCTTPRTLDTDSSELKAYPWASYTITKYARTSPTDSVGVDSVRIGGIQLAWRAVHRGYRDPATNRGDFAAYKIYRSNNSYEGPWTLIDSLPVLKADSLYTVTNDLTASTFKLVKYFIPTAPNVPYRYCVTSIDTSRNESAMTGYTYYPVSAEPNPSNRQSDVRVVPNPFKQVSGFPDQGDNKRLAFVNIPASCTIRIYTVALDLIKTIEHNSGAGIQSWGSQAGKDYMLTDFAQNVQPGIYIYQIESHVRGHEGETSVGKFAIIK